MALLQAWPAWPESAPWTVDQAIETAIKNNPQFQAIQARLNVSEAGITTAGARFNPAILSDNGIAEKTYRLGVMQTIELGGKRGRRIAAAQAQRDITKTEIRTALLDLRAEVRRAYTSLYNLQERQATLANILRVAQELVSIAHKREKAGDIATLEVLQTDILRVHAQNDLQTLNVELVNAKNRLNALLNQPLDTVVNLTPPNTTPQISPPPPTAPGTTPGILKGQVSQTDLDLNALVSQALSQRPEVDQNRQGIQLSRLQASLARGERIPNLSLAFGPDYVAEPGQRTVNVFVMGTLEIPIFNTQQGPLQEALAREQQLQKEQLAIKNRITLEVSNAYSAFKANQERIQRYEAELLPMSVQVTEKSRRAFEEGKTSILTPIQAQEAYMNARIGYLQALLDFQNAISDLERAVGTGL